VYELSIEDCFSAAHAISTGGVREPVHGHDWHVTVTIGGPRLDEDGLLCDFHTLQEALRSVTRAFHHRDLNATPPFDRTNPTAELVARHIADRLLPLMPEEARLLSVRVTETPGCAATYRPQ